MKNNTYDENAYKDITENPIILDFTDCNHYDKIHTILKEKFGLPDYYGRNWSALWDCLRYLFYDEGEFIVEIYGLNTLTEEYQNYCKKMLEIFERVRLNTPNVIFKVMP